MRTAVTDRLTQACVIGDLNIRSFAVSEVIFWSGEQLLINFQTKKEHDRPSFYRIVAFLKVQYILKWCNKYFLLRSNTKLGSWLNALPSHPPPPSLRVSSSRSKTACSTEAIWGPGFWGWSLVSRQACCEGGSGRRGSKEGHRRPAGNSVLSSSTVWMLGASGCSFSLHPRGFSVFPLDLRLAPGPALDTGSCHQESHSSPAGISSL